MVMYVSIDNNRRGAWNDTHVYWWQQTMYINIIMCILDGNRRGTFSDVYWRQQYMGPIMMYIDDKRNGIYSDMYWSLQTKALLWRLLMQQLAVGV